MLSIVSIFWRPHYSHNDVYEETVDCGGASLNILYYRKEQLLTVFKGALFWRHCLQRCKLSLPLLIRCCLSGHLLSKVGLLILFVTLLRLYLRSSVRQDWHADKEPAHRGPRLAGQQYWRGGHRGWHYAGRFFWPSNLDVEKPRSNCRPLQQRWLCSGRGRKKIRRQKVRL